MRKVPLTVRRGAKISIAFFHSFLSSFLEKPYRTSLLPVHKSTLSGQDEVDIICRVVFLECGHAMCRERVLWYP